MQQTGELQSSLNGPHVKRPRRHPVARWLSRLSLLLLVAIAIFGIWVLVWATRNPQINRNFVEEINAPVRAADPATLAWPEIKRALLSLPDESEPLWKMTWQLNKDWTELRPGDPAWPDVREYLRASQTSIQQLRDAASRPSLGYLLTDGDDPELSADGWRRQRLSPTVSDAPSTPNPRLLETRAAYIGKFRFATRILRADTRLALELGDTDRILANLRATTDLSRLAPQRGGLLGYLVSIAIDQVAFGSLAECLDVRSGIFSDSALRELQEIVSQAGNNRSLDVSLTSERMNFEDYLQRTFADDGHGNGSLTLQGVRELRDVARDSGGVKPTAWETTFALACGMFVVGDRKSQLNRYDQFVASARTDGQVPAWEFDGLSAATLGLNAPKRVPESIEFAPALLFVPSMTKVIEAECALVERRNATLAILAIHRFRIIHGKWPTSLSELVPELISELPTDRFSGASLVYHSQPAPLLYSIGINRLDDGGKPAPHHQYAGEWIPPTVLARSKRKLNWDHIYFPPSRTNEPAPSAARSPEDSNE